jgi:hypothetical protein
VGNSIGTASYRPFLAVARFRAGEALRVAVLAVVLGLLGALLPAEAMAARRALVIGIDAYQNVPRLEKAVGDAEAVGARLSGLGFTVTTVLDADRRTLNQAITEFRKSLKPGDDALVHFSGHGVEVDGNDLLLPADIPVPEPGDKDFLASEAISLSDLMRRVADSGAATQIFVIDACRDNPFAAEGTRGLGGTRGLAVVPSLRGSFVLYSAGSGQTALDTLGPGDTEPTSVYTRVLVESLGQPGQSLTDLAKTVRTRVSALASQVGHEQQPAYDDELNGEFFFAPTGSAEVPAPAAPEPAASVGEEKAFDAAQSINTVEAWGAFLKYHPSGYFADLAKAALAKLETKPSGASEAPGTVATTTPQPPPTQTTAAPRRLAIYGGLDFYGKDIFQGRVADPVECTTACLNDKRCVAFTFNANPAFTKGPNCFLKQGLGRLDLYRFAYSGLFLPPGDDAPPVLTAGVIDPKADLLAGQDMPGNDLAASPQAGADTLEKCRVACLDQGACRAFSFVKKPKQCWLKGAAGALSANAGVTSAIKRGVPVAPGQVIAIDR